MGLYWNGAYIINNIPTIEVIGNIITFVSL